MWITRWYVCKRYNYKLDKFENIQLCIQKVVQPSIESLVKLRFFIQL